MIAEHYIKTRKLKIIKQQKRFFTKANRILIEDIFN